MRRSSGFTLIEVLLATVLLAAGLALAFATLRSATSMTQRGEQIAQRNERMRAAEGFLRWRIASAQMLAYGKDDRTQQVSYFLGEPKRMRFVADLPDYLGRGGPYLHELTVSDDDAQLRVGFTQVVAGETFPEAPPRSPEVLAKELKSVRFRYRGLKAEGGLGEWQNEWHSEVGLPVFVSVKIEPKQGPIWPEMIVVVAHGSGNSHGERSLP